MCRWSSTAGILLKAARPKLLIISPQAQANALRTFLDGRRTTPTVVLSGEFSTSDAVEAAREILNAVNSRLQPIGA